MTPDLGRAFRELENQVRSDVVAPHPGEILVRARQQALSPRAGRRRRVRRTVGFVALAAAAPVALGLLLVLLPQPQEQLVPATPGPPAGQEPPTAAEDWANPTARRSSPDDGPTAAPDGETAVIAPGPVQVPTDPPETVEVTVWFQNDELREDGCRRWTEVTRDVLADDPIIGTIEAVLAGPTPEEREAGLFSVYGVGDVPTEAELTLEEDQRKVDIDFPDLYQVDYSERPNCRSHDLRGPVHRALNENFEDWASTFTVADSQRAFRAYVDQGRPIDEAMSLIEND